MSGLATLLRKELLEQWRTARLPVVATVFLLVGLSSPLLARFTPEILNAVGGDQFQIILPTPTAADAYDQLAKNLGQFGALIAILLAMGSVATEKERGTAALILTKPASRAAFLIAKIVAIATTLGVSTAIAAAGAWFYTTRPVRAVAGRGLRRRDDPPVARPHELRHDHVCRQYADAIGARCCRSRGRCPDRPRGRQHRSRDRALPAKRPGPTGPWPRARPGAC